jgi:UDP-3-O-[3-hydroxymyristoyl] glucosamine N-acyltransferase
MSKSFTSKQIAEFVGGKLTGDDSIKLSFLGPPMLADETMLAIAFEEQHIKALNATKALCVLVPEGISIENKTNIEVSRPKIAMGVLLNMFYEGPETPGGVHSSAIVDPSAKIGRDVSIGPNVIIEKGSIIGDNTRLMAGTYVGKKAQIGNNCLLYPQVFIGDRVKIGNLVIIHSGARIGSDGYSFVTQEKSNIETAKESGQMGQSTSQHIIKIPSLGSVIIEDDVEIGANTTIDRGTIQDTIIGRNTKIDNLVMIAHNVIIGESCFIVSQVGISGSTIVGDRVTIAGQAGLADHIKIGDDTIIMAKAGVSKSIPSKMAVVGIPAIPRKDFIKNQVSLKSMDSIKKRLKEIENALKEKEKV